MYFQIIIFTFNISPAFSNNTTQYPPPTSSIAHAMCYSWWKLSLICIWTFSLLPYLSYLSTYETCHQLGWQFCITNVLRYCINVNMLDISLFIGTMILVFKLAKYIRITIRWPQPHTYILPTSLSNRKFK